MRKFGLSLVLAVAMVMMVAGAAFAAHSNELTATTTPTWAQEYQSAQLGIAGNQTYTAGTAHYAVNGTLSSGKTSVDCVYCHEQQTKHTSGPHGGYTTTSNKCLTCHGLHARANNNKAWSARLLPGQTTVEVCNFCHDLTQSDLGPYFGEYMSGKTYSNNANNARIVKSAHRITGVEVYDNTNASQVAGFEKYNGVFNKADLIVPGGSQVTGGDRDLVTSGQGTLSGAAFTCDSCHTPHAINGGTVDPYFGESHIKYSGSTSATTFYAADKTTVVGSGASGRVYLTDRLLKARLEDPNKVRTTTSRVYTKYNSNWCAGCHQGRFTQDAATGAATVHNHPVSVGDANPKADGYKFLQLYTFTGGLTADDVINAAKTQVRNSAGYWIKPNFYTSAVAGARYVKNGTAYDGTPIWSDVIGSTDPRTNKQYAMTKVDPITGVDRTTLDGYITITDAAGGPSCQQCHGSARDVEQTFAAFASSVDAEQYAMNFPHVSENKALLVEEGDDFCTNCHGLDNLP